MADIVESENIIFWKDRVRAGSVFISGLCLLKAVEIYSFISMLSASFMLLVLSAAVIRIGHYVFYRNYEERRSALRRLVKVQLKISGWTNMARTLVDKYSVTKFHLMRCVYFGSWSAYCRMAFVGVMMILLGAMLTSIQIAMIVYRLCRCIYFASWVTKIEDCLSRTVEEAGKQLCFPMKGTWAHEKGNGWNKCGIMR